MEFMDTQDFNFSHFGQQYFVSVLSTSLLLTIICAGNRHEDLSHPDVKDIFANTFSDFHDLKIDTRSLHGHKHFTAWEWTVTCKAAQGPDGKRLEKEKAPPKKVIGCTLMWWSDKDKIIRNHEYAQLREPED